MYVCMYVCIFFVRRAVRPVKIPYWGTGRAELNYLQLLPHSGSPRTPVKASRINEEPRACSFPQEALSYSYPALR